MSKQPHPNPSPKEKGLTANTIARAIIISLSSLMSLSVAAQGEQTSSGLLRSDLKIYVVVAVLVIIFIGITLFLFSLERRLKKLEESTR